MGSTRRRAPRSAVAPAAALLLALWPATGIADVRAQAEDGVEAASPGEWTVIRPDGETGCAFGTPFRFFHREGTDPTRLVVYFQGGGACWHWVSCSGMFDTHVTEDQLAGLRGIFDLGNPENPFREHSILFVPYCTGDVHVGDATVRYGEESWEGRPVEHRGWANVTAALDWAGRHLPQPERLVVTGASAGSYGALFHAPNVAATFPAAELFVIGDSGVPLLHEYPRILERWGATGRLRALWGAGDAPEEADVTLEAAHAHLLRLRPDVIVAQITTDGDDVQRAFYLVSGSPEWRAATLALLRSLEERLPRFRAFVSSGSEHGLLRADRFYSLEVDGVRLRDWVDDLVQGRPVTSRYCEACD